MTSDDSSKKKPIKYNQDILRVYDLEAEGWRSFYLDSLISVDGLPVA